MSEPTPPTAEEQVRFLTNIQRLLAEGEFVASYKFALLLSLADLSVERGDESGAGLALTVAEISAKFIQYYWRQSVPYQPRAGGSAAPLILQQNTGRQAVVVQLLSDPRLREAGTLPRLCRNHGRWASLVRKVAQTIRVMPLWKLQTVGAETREFLYPNDGHGSRVTLFPGVAFCFRKFHGLIQDLVRGAWVRYVRRVNRAVLGDDQDLGEFLFGSERANLAPAVPALEEVQHGRCFYCARDLRGDDRQVDHFVPWSRYPLDLGHNFVLAHARCNARKSDLLPAQPHLDAWIERNDSHGAELTRCFDEIGFARDLCASLRIVRWAYDVTRAGNALTWMREKELVPVDAGWDAGLLRLMGKVCG